MSQDFEPLTIRKLLIVWAALSLVLVLVGTAALVYLAQYRAFVILLNALNLVLFLGVALFRKRIERAINGLIGQSAGLSVTVEYKHETQLAYVLATVFMILCTYVIVLSLRDVPAYFRLVQEDGLLEYCSAIFWFLAGVFLCLYIVRQWRGGVGGRALLPSLALLVFYIFCCGEEISWGQRLFHIEPADLIKSMNVQDEMTLHNMGSISVFSNAFLLATIAFFLLIPRLVQQSIRARRVFHFIHFPIPNRFTTGVYISSMIVWVFLGVRFGTLGFHPFSWLPEHYYNQMDDEAFELLIAYAFLCFSIFENVKTVARVRERAGVG